MESLSPAARCRGICILQRVVLSGHWSSRDFPPPAIHEIWQWLQYHPVICQMFRKCHLLLTSAAHIQMVYRLILAWVQTQELVTNP